MIRAFLVLFAVTAFAQFPEVTRIRDPVTGRTITWYRSRHHEVHHYYDISPWNPEGDRILFFRFDAAVETLTARGVYPGSLWMMNTDGSGAVQLAVNVKGNYHTGGE